MKKKLIVSVVSLFLFSFLIHAGFSEKVKTFTLKNGMVFHLYERHQNPTFTGMIMAKVGSVDEKDGETGLAHFFEHMAFKGTSVIGSKDFSKEKPILDKIDKVGEELSTEYAKGQDANTDTITTLREKLKALQMEHKKYVKKDEISKIYSENGGKFLNASTSHESTQYFIMLPTNRLELWFLIESERFKNSILREFYSERDVVAEERRMSRDNNPDGFLSEEFFNVALTRHPYRHTVVGHMEDIQTYTKPKAMNFFRTFYIPNNLHAAIVGDVQFEEVKKLAEKYFGDIPIGETPPRTLLIEPVQRGERRVNVFFDAEPRILISFQTIDLSQKEETALSLISMILSRGNSSRFKQDLVNSRNLAVSIFARANALGKRYPSLFLVEARTRHPHSPSELENAIYEHLDTLKSEPVETFEIQKVINQVEADLYKGMDSNIFIAMRMLRGSVLEGDIDSEFKNLEELKQITPQEIMQVAQKVFVQSNRTVGTLFKKEEGVEK